MGVVGLAWQNNWRAYCSRRVVRKCWHQVAEHEERLPESFQVALLPD
ncbi:hypothetical protein HMPREF9371_2253 [Neisseria shayeganii 871]|uniref:Uncharacterized protein n=1 Tax=Neisseria shayeganii 871 TaxID=1032488 RepID=G4CKW2_9NEIS|nr:hypothetical protein HMPREF9371_2253 [Neisseria shayeganii 871]